MGTFGIAFDTIVVGALALPWVFLVIHLFFPQNETRLSGILDWVNKQNQPAVAGVLLFAMAYPLGSVVSRIAQDCFDDDDLYVEAGSRHLFRVGVTMSGTRILTQVYCQEKKRRLISQTLIDALSDQPQPSGMSASDQANAPNQPKDPDQADNSDTEKDLACQYRESWLIPHTHEHISRAEGLALDIFHVQEGSLLLQGTDKNERIRQYHDERMVLRGAAFDGMVAFSLCLFWWSAERRSRLKYAVPLLYLVPGAIALHNHLRSGREASNPPLLEFTLLVLALAGWYLLWQRRLNGKLAPAKTGEQNERGDIRTSYLVLSLLLTITAFLGWQATEVLYDQQVIYSSYKALSEGQTKAPLPVLIKP
jgi:hypothetical protein